MKILTKPSVFLHFLGMLSATAVILPACTDDMAGPNGNAPKTHTASITASLGSPRPDSRTCVDEGTLGTEYVDLLWQTSDTLGVFGGSQTKNAEFTTVTGNTTEAVFSGQVTDGEVAEVAYFPYNKANKDNDADNLTGTLSLEQTYWDSYRAMDNDWKIGKPTDSDGVFQFTHLFSMVCYAINPATTDMAGERLEKVVLTVTPASGSEVRQLGGDFTFSANTGFKAFTSTPENCNTVTMNYMDRPELTASTTYYGFVNVAPNIRQGDVATIEVYSTKHVATVERTISADFQADYLYGFKLDLDADGVTVATRTDIVVDNELTSHPSLFLRYEDLSRIHKAIRTNAGMAGMHNHILSLCEGYLKETGLDYNIYNTHLMTDEGVSISEWYEDRIMSLAYAYRMTHKKKYAEKAIELMQKAAVFKDWYPKHFLDTSELGTGVALGYDWLYDCMTAAQRNTIAQAIYSKNLNATPGSSDVFTRTNNWNSICNAGRVICGLAVKKRYSNYSSAISTAVSGNPKLLSALPSSGCYTEGPDYFVYGNNYQALLVEALIEGGYESNAKTLMNTNSGVFLKGADWMLMECTPTGGTFNFSDCKNGSTVGMVMPWCAAYSGKAGYACMENKAFIEGRYSDFGKAMLAPLMSFLARVDLSQASAPDAHSFVDNSSAQPMYMYRSGWDSADDAYLAVKGGKANNSHGHMDAGSFIYEKNGVRWALDLGGQDYNAYVEASKNGSGSSQIWNYSNSTTSNPWTRWYVYRYRNEAHNTITINDAEHLYNGAATITGYYNESNKHGAKLDLQPALKYPSSSGQYVQTATREIYLDADNDLTVVDQIKAGSSKAATVRWTMVTEADVTVSGNTATLTKDGKTMVLSVASSSNLSTAVRVQTWSNEGPNESWDAKNTGTTRVGFTATIGSDKTATFTTTLKAQ